MNKIFFYIIIFIIIYLIFIKKSVECYKNSGHQPYLNQPTGYSSGNRPSYSRPNHSRPSYSRPSHSRPSHSRPHYRSGYNNSYYGYGPSWYNRYYYDWFYPLIYPVEITSTLPLNKTNCRLYYPCVTNNSVPQVPITSEIFNLPLTSENCDLYYPCPL
jgi:hypothetical protein